MNSLPSLLFCVYHVSDHFLFYPHLSPSPPPRDGWSIVILPLGAFTHWRVMDPTSVSSSTFQLFLKNYKNSFDLILCCNCFHATSFESESLHWVSFPNGLSLSDVESPQLERWPERSLNLLFWLHRCGFVCATKAIEDMESGELSTWTLERVLFDGKGDKNTHTECSFLSCRFGL